MKKNYLFVLTASAALMLSACGEAPVLAKEDGVARYNAIVEKYDTAIEDVKKCRIETIMTDKVEFLDVNAEQIDDEKSTIEIDLDLVAVHERYHLMKVDPYSRYEENTDDYIFYRDEKKDVVMVDMILSKYAYVAEADKISKDDYAALLKDLMLGSLSMGQSLVDTLYAMAGLDETVEVTYHGSADEGDLAVAFTVDLPEAKDDEDESITVSESIAVEFHFAGGLLASYSMIDTVTAKQVQEGQDESVDIQRHTLTMIENYAYGDAVKIKLPSVDKMGDAVPLEMLLPAE